MYAGIIINFYFSSFKSHGVLSLFLNDFLYFHRVYWIPLLNIVDVLKEEVVQDGFSHILAVFQSQQVLQQFAKHVVIVLSCVRSYRDPVL